MRKSTRNMNAIVARQVDNDIFDFQAVFCSMPGLYLVLKPNLSIVAANDAYLHTMMKNREEILGRGIFDVFPDSPDDPDAKWMSNLRASLNRVLQGRMPDTMAAQMHLVRRPASAGGGFEERYWSSLNSPVFGSDKKLAYIIHRIEDVTELIELKQAEKESGEMFRHTFDGAPNGLIMTDEKGQIALANAPIEKIFGYTRDELIGQPIEILIPAGVRDSHRNYRHSFMLAPESRRMGVGRDLYGVRKDGGEVPVEIGLSPITTKKGKFTLSTVVDISERKRREEAIREGEQRLRLALEATGVGFWEWNVLTDEIRWDAQMFKIYGIPPTEEGVVPYSTWSGAVLAEDLPEQERVLQDTVRKAGRGRREFRIRKPDEAVFRYVEAVETVRTNAAGQVEWVVGTNLDITDRKRAAESLHVSEERLRLAQDAAHIGTFDWNIKTGSNVWTPELEAMYGLPPGGFAQTQPAWESLVHPEDRTNAVSLVERAIETGQPVEGEWRVVWPDKSIHWLMGRFQVFKDAAGEPLRMTGVNLDITPRRAAEDKVRATEAQHRLVTDALPVLISYIDRDLRYRMANQTYRKWFGVDTDEVDGMRVDEVLGSAAFEAVRPSMERALSGESVSFEKLVPYKGAGLRHVHISYIPDFDRDGRARGFAVLVEDITQQKVAMLSLQESEARFRAIYEYAPIGIMQMDLDTGRLLEVNHYLCSLFGSSRDEILLKRVGDILQMGDLFDDQSEIGISEVREIEGSLLRGDGGSVPVRAVSSIIRVESGPRYRLVLVENLTEKKLAEQERVARREAEQTNKMKDEFLATLSHELRAPLNSILGWIQLSRKRKQIPDELEEALGAIERAGKAQSQLIADILDVNRISSGKLRLDVKTPVDAAHIVDSAIEIMLPTAKSKNIRLEKRIDGSLPFISGDPRRLQQCIWNLLSNAIKFSPVNGRVVVDMKSTGTDLEIVVSDNGKGISADLLPHIFERYMQADSSSTRTHGGLGLGLAIVKHIIDLHGGSITAESPGEGRGSIFSIKLPACSASSSGPVLESGAEGALAGIRLDGLKILVVDDELEAREVVRGLLQDAGAVVVTAGSVDEGLRIVETNALDLIISDLAMSSHNGYYFIRQVRKLPRERAKIPAIALTAYASDTDRINVFDAGFQKHLSKPIDSGELLSTIAQLCISTDDRDGGQKHLGAGV